MKRTTKILRKHIRKLTIPAAVTGLLLLALAGCKDFSFFNELGVKGGLTITPASVSILTGGTMSFNAYGGNGDYVFSIISGCGGTIDPATGVYTAPGTPCTEVVMVTDSTNLSATATIDVVSSQDELEINPKVATLSPGSSITFVATGGNSASYDFSFQTDGNKSGGTITPGGVYTAGPVTGESDTIIVTDYDSTVCAIPANVSVVAATSDVNYSVTADTFVASADAGAALSGTFTVTNLGTGNGSKPVSWWLYLSDDGSFGGSGETLITSNSTAALSAGNSTTVTPTGTWPVMGGTYTLFIMVSAEDDMTHSDNIYEKTDSEITLTVPDVDYRVTSITNTSENHVGEPISGIVSVDNAGTDDGITSFTLNVYVSTNTAVDVGDTLVYSTTDTGLPGDDPLPTSPTDYSYSGTWPSNPDSYYLVAEVISTDDTAAGNDGDNTTAIGPYTVHYRDVDYQVPLVTHLTGTGAGAGVTGEFDLDHAGTDDGLADITWKVYASANNTMVDVGDELIASDTITGGMKWDDPVQTIGFGGNWPFEPDLYYLVVEVSASDDTQAGNAGNNEKATGSPVDVVAADVDYYADAISATPGVAGGSMNVSFDLNNGGTDASNTTITWNLYVSDNEFLDVGDYLAASGSYALPNSPPDSATITPAGAVWPSIPGDYYLIVEVESLEDIAATNDGNDVEATTVTFPVAPPVVDYTVTGVTHVGGGEKAPGQPFDGEFQYANNGASAANNGARPLSWTVYASVDQNLDPTDVGVGSGTGLDPLDLGTTSGVETFSGFWPLDYGDYYLIVKVQSPDDEQNTNNDYGATGTSAQIGVYTESEPNDEYQHLPGGAGGFDILFGATPATPIVLEPGMSIKIEGLDINWDDYGNPNKVPAGQPEYNDNDTFMFNTGSANSITFTLLWNTGTDCLAIFVYEAGGPAPAAPVLSSLSIGGLEDELSKTIAKGGGTEQFAADQDLWFNVYYKPTSGTTGPYTVIITAN